MNSFYLQLTLIQPFKPAFGWTGVVYRQLFIHLFWVATDLWIAEQTSMTQLLVNSTVPEQFAFAFRLFLLVCWRTWFFSSLVSTSLVKGCLSKSLLAFLFLPLQNMVSFSLHATSPWQMLHVQDTSQILVLSDKQECKMRKEKSRSFAGGHISSFNGQKALVSWDSSVY